MKKEKSPKVENNLHTLKKKKKVLLWDAQIYSDVSKYKVNMCPLVDQSILLSPHPLTDPALIAADLWCRVERMPKPQPGEEPTQSPQIPILVEQPDGKVFYGLISRDDLENAQDACTAISSALPAIMGQDPDTLILSVVSKSACKTISEQLAADNPMVVLASTNVIATGLVNDFADLLKENPELEGIGKIIKDLNNKMADTIRDTIKKPIDYAISHPEEALKLMAPKFALIGEKQAEVLAQQTLAFMKVSQVPKDQLKQAIDNLDGGDGAKILKGAAEIIIPPDPQQLAASAQQAAEEAQRAAERARDDLERSDLNPGNWHL